MSVYRCSQCGCMENTACSNYWSQRHPMTQDGEKINPLSILCTQCDPEFKKWHGMFPRTSAQGMILCSDGFLYYPEDVESQSFKFRMKHQDLKVVGEIKEEGIL